MIHLKEVINEVTIIQFRIKVPFRSVPTALINSWMHEQRLGERECIGSLVFGLYFRFLLTMVIQYSLVFLKMLSILR